MVANLVWHAAASAHPHSPLDKPNEATANAPASDSRPAARPRRSWLLAGVTLADGAVADVIVAGGTIAYVGPALPLPPATVARNLPKLDLRGFVLLRSAFLGTLENPEPRYTLECYPAIVVLASSLLAGRTRHGEKPA